MSITIIECAVDSITLISFIKKGNTFNAGYESRRLLGNTQNETVPAEWLREAIQVIDVLVGEAKMLFPVVILLPGFPFLMKTTQVPRVSLSRQREVIQTHIHSIFGTGREEHLAYDIIDSGEFEWEVICFFVKKQWIESFCKGLEPLGLEIISIEASAIHYYNFYKKEFSRNDVPLLLTVFQNAALYYFFVNGHLISIHQARVDGFFYYDELKGLIDLYDKKFPEDKIQEILILNQGTVNGDFINGLENCTGLQTKLLPLPSIARTLGSIGATGAAHRELFGVGLRVDLIPSEVKKVWIFNRSKKAILWMGLCMAASCLILLNDIHNKRLYFEEKERACETRILPLRELAVIVDRNEKTVALYNEGLSSLESYIRSNRSWLHIMNSLQSAIIKIPDVRIHTLKVVDMENKLKSSWEDKLMKSHNHETPIDKLLIMQITGSFTDQEQFENGIIDKIKQLTSEFEKLEFVSEIKNLHFDSDNLPKVSFLLSLALRSQIF